MTENWLQHKQRGNDAYRSGKYHNAVQEYTKCIEMNARHYLPFANRAMCYLKLGKYHNADADCTSALRLHPKYVKGYLRRGAARKALERFELALQDFQMVLQLQPTNTQARQEFIRIQQILTKKANDNSKRKTKINKIDSSNNSNLANEYETLQQNHTNTKDKTKHKIFYGQLVVGPPGSGKSTYCNVIEQYMTNVLHRNVAIINLDPNNETMEYHPWINICDLITSDDVAKQLHLGPNGSLIYCLEYLSQNMQWLRERLDAGVTNGKECETYLIFDCPGQIELYIHHPFMRKITDIMVNEWHYRMSCVNLVDCHHCCTDLRNYDSSNFISVALMTTSMMLHLELPHINVLSKCDLMQHYDKNIIMPMEFFTNGQDLERLSQSMYGNKPEDELLEIEKKFKHLNNELAQCINDYGLVSFVKFSITDLNSMKDVCKLVDKSNGYDLMGEYYKQMEMEQKILMARLSEMDTENDEEMKTQQMQTEEEEDDVTHIFGVDNPLLQNTPFDVTITEKV
eukprot:74370_1